MIPHLEEMLLCFKDERNPNLFRRPVDGSEVMTHEGVAAINELLEKLKDMEPSSHLAWETPM